MAVSSNKHHAVTSPGEYNVFLPLDLYCLYVSVLNTVWAIVSPAPKNITNITPLFPSIGVRNVNAMNSISAPKFVIMSVSLFSGYARGLSDF